ncbi:hypothetical protein QR98_0075730 [Sarcoptes scabiei]|uniref:Uncharacterized protein n=1 Tax=Sarcoptes scabiei TaxID=52283 RepID=A0A132ADN8_SARSC|nr:hypothetical protein QR98_0075730 [Sarcoptes scabiei]
MVFRFPKIISVVKGQIKVGDRVYCECTYSKSLPFNWNASIVQPISSSFNPSHQSPSSFPPQSSHNSQSSPRPAATSAIEPRASYNLQSPQTSSNLAGPNSSVSLQSDKASMYHHQGNNPSANDGYQQYPNPNKPQLPYVGQQQNQIYANPPSYQAAPVQQSSHLQQQQPIVNAGQQPSGVMNVAPAAVAAAAAGFANADLAKVQQAMANLVQYYNSNSSNLGSVPTQQQGRQEPSLNMHPGSDSHQYGDGNQLQFTSTPGNAFIANQQQQPPHTPQHGSVRQHPSGRWDHPRDQGPPKIRPAMTREDPRTTNSRFCPNPINNGPPISRFNDSDRFSQAPSLIKEERFGQGSNFTPSQQDIRRDFPQRSDIRKDERRFRDKDVRQIKNKDQDSNKTSEKVRKEKENRREKEKDRERSSKRSLSPAASVASGGGSRSSSSNHSSKRRYEVCFVPKSSIIRDRYTCAELKSRFGNSVHIPSDLKEILYNVEAEIDIFNMPKPIIYKISSDKEKEKKGSEPKKSAESADSKSQSKKSESKSSENEKNIDETCTNGDDNDDNNDVDYKTVDEIKKDEIEMENFEEKNQEKTLSHKYNVKVLLISLPSLAEIYERLFGSEFIGNNQQQTHQSGRNQVSHFHKLLSLLVTRNANDGYSLIGGKFVQEKDGFLPESTQPNLVATAIRVVWENTGLNLKSCRRWTVLSTFIYNRDNCLVPNQSIYEITKIYLPEIWSALNEIYSPLVENCENDISKIQNETIKESESEQKDIQSSNQRSDDQAITIEKKENESFQNNIPMSEDRRKNLLSILESINNMKVTELKNELEKLGVKYESRWKKEQLFQKLQTEISEVLKTLDNNEEQIVPREPKNDCPSTETEIPPADQNLNDSKSINNDEDQNVSAKRKQDDESHQEENNCKKMKLDKPKSAQSFAALPTNIKVKSNMSLVSLHNALNPHRFDQFELIIVAELLRDSLVYHFTRYLYSSIVYNIESMKSSPITSMDQKISISPNFVHLAFSYFDKNHSGYMMSDDLNHLFQMTGFPFSKKSLNSLISSLKSSTNDQNGLNDRVFYANFQQPSTLIARNFHYPTMNQSKSECSIDYDGQKSSNNQLIIERNSIQYNIDELIKQSENDQKIKVHLNDALMDSSKRIARLESSVNELESKQKKMSAATGRQNDELCAVKRERDSIKSKYEQLRKFLQKSFTDYQNLIKTLDKDVSVVEINANSQKPIQPKQDVKTSSTVAEDSQIDSNENSTTATKNTSEISLSDFGCLGDLDLF